MVAKRKLIILSFDYPPSTGGVARLCHEVTLGMQKYYNHIKVITVDAQGIAQPYEAGQGVELIKVSTRRLRSEIEVVKILRALEDKASYDVICGLWHPEGFLAQLAGMKRIFILGHGAEFLPGNSKMRKHFWLPVYGRKVLRKATRVITNSQYTAGLVKNLSAKATVQSLPLGVDPVFFSPSKELKQSSQVIRFCTVSRILDFKGHDFILKTFESLPSELRARIEWHIAGTGTHSERLEALIAASPIQSQVKMYGFVPDEKLPDFYRDNDVFILATRTQKISNQVEGFGLVFLEAQSSGVPTIGTRTGGISDAIEDGNGGWLFEQDDTASLVPILKKLLSQPNVIVKQSIKARKRVVDSCTWEMYCDALYKIIAL